MAATLELRADLVRSLGFASIVVGYTAIGTQLSHPTRIFMMQNLTDAELMFSFDGVNDHFVLAASGFILLDVTTNDIDGSGFFISKGSQLMVKRIGTPTKGNVYLSTFYARGT